MSINRKKVYRIMREQGWQARKIIRTPRPRVQDKRSVVSTSNTRWAIDATSLWSKNDNWIGMTCKRLDEIEAYEKMMNAK